MPPPPKKKKKKKKSNFDSNKQPFQNVIDSVSCVRRDTDTWIPPPRFHLNNAIYG